MNRFFIAALLTASGIAAASAADAPRWLRNTAISPDGTKIAFTYKGDIYTVDANGGKATQLTTNQAYDTTPIWSPDGQTIAFQSFRDGSADIFIMPAGGGTPRRVTTNSGAETPLAFLDNTQLLFSASQMPTRETSRGFMPQTYVVDTSKENPRPRTYLSLPMKEASVNASGELLYSDRKGVENVWRKHERSSGTSDIWLRSGDSFTKLTDFNGHDLNPVWKTGGDGFFFLSEEDGTLNVYETGRDGKGRRQLTKFTQHPVRSLSAAANGRLAFSWDGDIYTLTPGGQPQKVTVEIVSDQYDPDKVKYFAESGVSNFAVSPDGKEVAFVIRGDIYVTDTKYETTKRITDTPSQERCLSFSPDGRTLVYDSDRDGYWQLFTASIKNPDEKQFAYATEIVEEPLYKCATSAQQPEFSPDGKKVAFLEGRDELRVIDVKTKEVNTALDGKYNYSYSDGDITFQWSPDSKWLLSTFFTEGGWNNLDIALVKADGSEVVDLTESGYSDGNPQWAMGGKAITFSTAKYGMKNHGSWGNQDDIVFMALDQEAWDDFNMTEEEAALKEKAENEKKEKEAEAADKKKDKKKKDGKDDAAKVEELKFDLGNRRYRTRRLTENSAFIYDYFLAPKGDKLYFIANATEGGYNLLQRDLKKGETKVMLKGIAGGILPDKKGENLFVLGADGLKKIDLGKGDAEPVAFKAVYDRKPSQEREYIYDHMLRQVNDKFYDKNLHGVDWAYYGDHYREFLPHVSNNHDFAILLSEILGELNASHTGGGYRPSGHGMATANLGAFYDESYEGDGLKVTELLPRSPLASKEADVKPGDIIMAIDDVRIKAGEDYFPAFEGKAGSKARIEIKRADGKTDYATVKPLGAGERNGLVYQRWIERNERTVDSVSGGRVGYVHVEGMDNESFRTVYDRLLGKYRNCDAVIVDTRHNGGGWLHNDLAVILSGREYAKFMPRGKYIGSEPFSQWHKPSVMLVNESNYSDAHGSPYAYQTLKIGDVVGAPIPGTMTAVWWETQIDPTLYFGIPQVANTNLDGKPLENVQLNPEVIIYNTPEHELNGIDDQLIGATRHLMEKINRQNK